MENSVEIENLIIKLGDNKIKITPKEAKKLQKILNDFFGNTQVNINLPSKRETYPCTYPVYVSPYPIKYLDEIPYYIHNQPVCETAEFDFNTNCLTLEG